MQNRLAAIAGAFLICSTAASASELSDSVKADYDGYLADLFDHFHRNPELSLAEFRTAERVAKELRGAGYEVTEGVGGTGVVGILENGAGPLVMMRADMDGLPVKEKTGLPYASKAQQRDPVTGVVGPVMHACGHDMHMTSLIGSARQMAERKDEWSGTLMLVAQPAEERGMGAKAMRADNIWERFGQPDYALGLHVKVADVAGIINVNPAPYAGVDSVDIVVHGVGGHGAYPHLTKDPIVIGSQIVLALQTLVARELAPRTPGVVTVGAFHAGAKHNIISDEAHLKITVRNTSPETRETLLNGIRRIAENIGRAAGLPEDKLPEVTIGNESVPPLINDERLIARLKMAWIEEMGEDAVISEQEVGMGGEDFPFFTVNPTISSVYWDVGGTPQEDFDREAAGGPAVAGHHSPLFKIAPETTVRAGVESTVVALLELMGD
ncbi:MAG: amidohydrolase [Gammaproteobacteria bacterium]|nr:amidohydrolase [Gammaproteobacteria bacterium]MDH3373973.1 amidohydrolase [Gammaproteobacteria bacterium]